MLPSQLTPRQMLLRHKLPRQMLPRLMLPRQIIPALESVDWGVFVLRVICLGRFSEEYLSRGAYCHYPEFLTQNPVKTLRVPRISPTLRDWKFRGIRMPILDIPNKKQCEFCSLVNEVEMCIGPLRLIEVTITFKWPSFAGYLFFESTNSL